MTENKPKYKNLVLSGGSVRGISEVGAVKKLIEEGLIDLKQLDAVAGTSAGAMFGILIVLGFGIDEIWHFLYCLDMKKMVKPDFFMFFKECGIENGQIIHNLFEDILARKTNIKHINFEQLYQITKIHFTVVGSCLTTKEAVYYDHVNTPDFQVSMAIRISISMPCFFVPVVLEGKVYIDGGIVNNYPINLFKDRLEDTIGIVIGNQFNTDYKCPEQFFISVYNLFMYNYQGETIKEYGDNTIYIEEKSDKSYTFNFDIDSETKVILYNSGRDAAQKFIDKLKNK